MDRLGSRRELSFLVSVFVIATCGLVYELIAGTLASYLLGDSVLQFSTIIGCYLFSMGIGSYLSRFIERNLIDTFIRIEILVGVVGGVSAGLLFVIFEHVESFRVVLYLLVGLIGILVGIEIPLLLRILQDKFEFKDLVSKVFTFDYIGALFASILFPLVLVPYLGLIRSSLLFGMFNVGVALWLIHTIRTPALSRHKVVACVSLVVLAALFAMSEQLLTSAEASTFHGNVIYSKHSKYQRISLVRSGRELRLFLNGNLQFSSLDEYRYHELLVHPALGAVPQRSRVLVLGGGDGLAVREILKYDDVREVVVVDLDREMTKLFRSAAILKDINHDSLNAPRVSVVNQDAFQWIKSYSGAPFDAIIIDFPDPSNYSVGKLYSVAFYKSLQRLMGPSTVIAVQSTSPFFARASFWCVVKTVSAAGLETLPYHVYVPSFGEWGFVLAGYRQPVSRITKEQSFITQEVFDAATHFPNDMAEVNSPVNRLDDQVLVRLFTEEWARYVN
jgi:spermidine synthase